MPPTVIKFCIRLKIVMQYLSLKDNYTLTSKKYRNDYLDELRRAIEVGFFGAGREGWILS
jgi:hypothetical protein